jgi:diaminopimelate decarboxylase
LADTLLESGLRLQYVDMGGGLAIDYSTGRLPDIESWLRNLAEPIVARGYRLLVEPGRAIVGPAGLLLCRVRYLKDQDGRQIAITDAGMNDLLRPALYGARHPIVPIKLLDSVDARSKKLFDVVGPVCETADVLATDCAFSALSRGDLLAVLMSGAYGYSMSSNYNGRLRPAEALVEGNSFRCIRRRERYDALLSGTSQVRGDA